MHVVYAVPADVPDRFDVAGPAIARDVAAIDSWWRRQDPARAPRWDLFRASGCSGFDALDISHVRLPRDTSYYFTSVDPDSFNRIAAHIRGDPLDLHDLGKKYLVFYDGPVRDDDICGISSSNPTLGGPFGYSLVYVRSCGLADLGTGGVLAAIAVHELIHNLGGESSDAPHECFPTGTHHPCDSAADILYPSNGGLGLADKILDVGHDDYYGHRGRWWDVRDSPWLAHLDAPTVSLAIGITGGGSVTGSLPGTACDSACTSSWDAGSRVRLTARPQPGWRFVGWTGACRGRKTCTVRLTSGRAVRATFSRT